MSQCICENPTIILNPLVPELIAKYKHYVMNDRHYVEKFNYRFLFSFPYSKFSAKKLGITTENMHKYFIIDDSTGEFFDMYMQVPCGKCDVCKYSKVNSFVHRCKLESMCYDSSPWFCTLTYNDDTLPKDGLCKRDVQLFLKRFRINLTRNGFYDKIRYVAVGEYGKNTHRAHYHLLIWNINSFTTQQYQQVSDIFTSSWSKGYVMHRLVDLKDERSFYYTSKYLRKDCFVPKGCNPTFCNSSRGNGGIGAHYLDKIKPELQRKMNVNFKFLNKWTNKVEPLQFSRYILNRVFPSFSRAVPISFRKALRDFCAYKTYIEYRFSHLTDQLNFNLNKFYHEKVLPFAEFYYLGTPLVREVPVQYRTAWHDTMFGIRTCVEEIQKFFDRYSPSYFGRCRYVEDKRRLFLSNLFLYSQDVDINLRSIKARQSFARAVANEIL